MMKRIGLFFGSFNPIHVGHLMLAQTALLFANVEEVWFVVSPQNPFKQQSDLAPADVRVMLARLAVKDDANMYVSDVELRLPVPSYTVRTLECLRSEHPDCEFVIIMGGDNLAGLPKWRQPDEILKHHEVVVYPRPGETVDTSAVEVLGGRVSILNAPQMDISSTQIRRWLAEGRSVRHFVPEPVWEKLCDMNFYTTTDKQ